MISKVLGQSAFWIVNKELSKKLDIYPTLLLSDLIDKQEYFRARGELDNEGFFFNTSEDIEESTTLTYHVQKKCIKRLEESQLLDTKLKGIPAKVHFKVNEIKILNFLNTSIRNIPKQVLEEFETNNNKYNNKDTYPPAEISEDGYTETKFLDRWKAARLYYDKQPTHVKLKHHSKQLFKELSLQYTAKQFDTAINGLFKQNTFPAVRLNPEHFLENFEKYLTSGITGEKLYEQKKKKTDNTGMI